MNSVSFKANLVVDDKLYTKMPEGTPENFTDDLLTKYRKFVDHKIIKQITEGDTITIYKKPYRAGFALGLDFKSDKLPEVMEGGIHTNKKIPEVHVGSMIYQTMQFIIVKSGIKQGFFEPTKDAFLRAVKVLYQKEEPSEE